MGGMSGLTSTPDTGKSILRLLLIFSQNKPKLIPLSRDNLAVAQGRGSGISANLTNSCHSERSEAE